jgi:anti-sigma factor RsiW
MDGTTNVTAVTPKGVRAGDPEALRGLVERRGPAVLAFCTQVCGPDAATTAAGEALARFRAAVRDTPDLNQIDPEGLLRGATRHAAAAMARVPLGPPPTGKLRSRGTETCGHVPVMLAARAGGALSDGELDRLTRHMAGCERCDALGEIFRRAEIAYADPSADTLPGDTFDRLLDALESVSPEGPGFAPAPIGQSALPTQITGALPPLPELEDEVPLRGGHDDERDDTPASAVPAPTARGNRFLRIGVPAGLAAVVAVVVVLASGVLRTASPTPATARPLTVGLQAPVTTPLPVTVDGAVVASDELTPPAP